MAARVRVTTELEVVVRSARGSSAVGDSPPLARACTRACLAFPFAAGLLACCSSIITRARLVVCLAMQIFPSFLGETFVTGGTDHNQGAIGFRLRRDVRTANNNKSKQRFVEISKLTVRDQPTHVGISDSLLNTCVCLSLELTIHGEPPCDIALTAAVNAKMSLMSRSPSPS